MLRRARASSRIKTVPAESGPSAHMVTLTALEARRRNLSARHNAKAVSALETDDAKAAPAGAASVSSGWSNPLCEPLQLLVMLFDVRDDVIEHRVLRLQMLLQLQALAEDRLGVVVVCSDRLSDALPWMFWPTMMIGSRTTG